MSNDWQAVSEFPPLGPGELHIWRTDVSFAVAQPEIYRQHLSQAEAERAERLRAGPVRMQFVVARACLRVMLGSLLGMPANRIPVIISAYGKPNISQDIGDPLFFNVAHSRETILIALCRASPVGIDLEYLDRQTDALEIARNSFHANEIMEIEGIADPARRQKAFFRCWTRKEAIIKAEGRGLSLALATFQVPVLDPAASTPVHIADGDAAPQTWFVSDIGLGDEIAGAFATRLPNLIARTFSFPLDQLTQGLSKT